MDMKLSYDNQGEFSKKLFIETYGCQMNVADSEVVASVMKMAGYRHARCCRRHLYQHLLDSRQRRAKNILSPQPTQRLAPQSQASPDCGHYRLHG